MNLTLLIVALLAFAGFAEKPSHAEVEFSDDVASQIAETAETFEFQTEVNRVMEILIHSLYSNKEIFLRELISNAEDALDKMHFIGLTDKEALGETSQLEIRIHVDDDKKTLTIRDTGVGMSADELKANLGTIARSGTSKFLEAMEQGDNLSLIGQFGVGFYSAFLVADKVTVVSKSNKDDKQWVWQSDAEGSFTIAEDPRGDTLGRGTSITLHMKQDAHQYLQEYSLETTVQKYSQFMSYPIYLEKCKKESKQVPLEPGDEGYEEEEEEEEDEDENDMEVGDEEDEDEDDEDDEQTKTVYETICEWEQLNKEKPIWLRKSSEIEDEEYTEFYQALTKNHDDPMSTIHFSAEGEIEFRSLLFIPGKAAHDLYDQYYAKPSSLRLYVRRVLISDEFEDFIPRYLSFVKGLVDSNDLPLNVNREQLQKSTILNVIGKKVTRKVLDTLRKMAVKEEDEMKGEEEEEEEPVEDEEDEEEKEENVPEKLYTKFWTEYGKSLKLGVIEDSKNRKKLANLLRYTSTASPEELTSLQDYVDRMKDGQQYIFYISGETQEQVESSPFLQQLEKRGLEVLFFVDPLDEYVTQHMTEYEGFKIQAVTKEGLDLGESDKEKKRKKEIEEEYSDLTTWLKGTLGKKVEKVVLSWRLTDHPAVLVTGKYGYSLQMEKIAKAQAFGSDKTAYMFSKKTLEINPRHPIVRKLKEEHLDHPEDDNLQNAGWLLYDQALLSSGGTVDKPEVFAGRLEKLLRSSLDIDMDAEVEEEEDYSLLEDLEEDVDEEDDEEEEFMGKDEL